MDFISLFVSLLVFVNVCLCIIFSNVSKHLGGVSELWLVALGYLLGTGSTLGEIPIRVMRGLTAFATRPWNSCLLSLLVLAFGLDVIELDVAPRSFFFLKFPKHLSKFDLDLGIRL